MQDFLDAESGWAVPPPERLSDFCKIERTVPGGGDRGG